MSTNKTNRGYLAATIGCRCPRCREGKLFEYPVTPFNLKKNTQMNQACVVCGQPTEIEVGFYYGTSYVSYAITVFLSVISLAVWWLTVGLSIYDNRFFYWMGMNAVLLLCLQPWLMRLSRSFWISWFVRFDADWRQNKPQDYSERLNAEQGANW